MIEKIMASSGENTAKFQCSNTPDENVKCTATLENSMAVSQKVKHRVTTCLRSSTPRYKPKELKTYIHTELEHESSQQHY